MQVSEYKGVFLFVCGVIIGSPSVPLLWKERNKGSDCSTPSWLSISMWTPKSSLKEADFHFLHAFPVLRTSGSCVILYFSGGLLRADYRCPGLTTHAQRRVKDCYNWILQPAHYDCENKTPLSEQFNCGMAKWSEAFARCCQQVKSASWCQTFKWFEAQLLEILILFTNLALYK